MGSIPEKKNEVLDMKLGSTVEIFAAFGEKRYAMMKKYGFDYADCYFDGELRGKTEEEYDASILAEKALADQSDVTIWQVHGPWRYPPHDETPEMREERAKLMRRSIRATALVGCKYWVIHPLFPFGDCGFDMDSFWKINLDFFKNALVPYAEQCGVTICFENMPMKSVTMSTTEKSLEFIHMIGSDNVKLCLDTGHEAVFGLSPADAVRRAGKDLKVLHVHDNNGKYDQHLVPLMGVIDFKEFGKALKEIEFDGVFSLELDLSNFLPGAERETKIKAIRAILEDILPE